MKKLLLGMLVGVALLAVSGCREKTTEEKLKDAATAVQKDANKAATEVKKDATKALDDLKKD